MKNVKKLMALLLAVAMCGCLVTGCGSKKDTDGETAGGAAGEGCHYDIWRAGRCA